MARDIKILEKMRLDSTEDPGFLRACSADTFLGFLLLRVDARGYQMLAKRALDLA
jgi:hypothetical protein